MKVASLFTGAGGLDLGLHQAGHEVILQCESDPGAQQETELLAAGFPCIDVSRAGLRAGLQGKSSGLVRHVFRLLEQALKDRRGVPWVLLENVEALLDRTGGQPPLIEFVVGQFEALGYHSWAHRVVSSAGFGLPNRRKRVFVLASLHGDARDVLLSQGKEFCQGACSHLFGKCCYSCHDPDPAEHHCAYALDLGNARSSPVIDMVPTFTTSNERICLLMARSGQMGSLRIEDAERLQGLPEGHTEACYPLLRPGVDSHRAAPLKDSDADKREAERWALIGNAVTVPVAKWLGERLMLPYRYKYSVGADDRKMKASNSSSAMQVAPRDHFLDNSGMADSDDDAVVEGTLFDAPTAGRDPLTAQNSALDDLPGSAPDQTPEPGLLPGSAGSAPETAFESTLGSALRAAADVASAVILRTADASSVHQAMSQADTHSSMQNGNRLLANGAGAVGRAQGQGSGAWKRGGSGVLQGWPKAAWYLKGMGRYGVHSMSEAPLIKPLEPLGDFITQLGRPPSKSAMHTYFMRLREQGWDVSHTVKKALQCGASLDKEVGQVVRLAGQSSDADSCGTLVWAQAEEDVWWPAEALDPFEMPPGRSLPPAALAELTPSQLRATLPATHPLVRPLQSLPPNPLHPLASPQQPIPVTTFQQHPQHSLAGTPSSTPPGRLPSLTPFTPAATDVPPFAAGSETRAVSAAARAAAAIGGAVTRHKKALVTSKLSDTLLPNNQTPATPAAETLQLEQHGLPDEDIGAAGARGVDKEGHQGDLEQACHVTADLARPSKAGGIRNGPASNECLVLVIYLGDARFKWLPKQELLPFAKHKQQKVAEAQALIAFKQLTKPILFNKALKEAGELVSLQQRQKDSEGYLAAVAGRAAVGAAAANLRKRCNQCEACLTPQGNQRRCLTNRAAAAAAGGHSGAQVAILKHAAIGAHISVWWPLDERWYSGVVHDFDRLRHRHTVSYQDGDMEIIPLWAPNQMVRIESDPKDWPAEAARLAAQRAQREAIQTTLTKEKQAAEEEARAAAEQAAKQREEASLTGLEAERRANIKRNQQRMAAFGLQTPSEPSLQAATEPVPTKRPRTTKYRKKACYVTDNMPPMFHRDSSKQQVCNACESKGMQTEMQPCVSCLGKGRFSGISWCHELCLSVAARHRLDKGRAVDWLCNDCMLKSPKPM